MAKETLKKNQKMAHHIKYLEMCKHFKQFVVSVHKSWTFSDWRLFTKNSPQRECSDQLRGPLEL